MRNPEENNIPEIDEETREQSAEQRNITAPTPPDVRAKAEADKDEEDEDDEEEPEPPARDSR